MRRISTRAFPAAHDNDRQRKYRQREARFLAEVLEVLLGAFDVPSERSRCARTSRVSRSSASARWRESAASESAASAKRRASSGAAVRGSGNRRGSVRARKSGIASDCKRTGERARRNEFRSRKRLASTKAIRTARERCRRRRIPRATAPLRHAADANRAMFGRERRSTPRQEDWAMFPNRT